MKRTNFEKVECGIAQALERVGDWWTLLIIREALFGTVRFADFQENLGIASNILTTRLNHMLENGLIEKSPDPEDKRKTYYHLTQSGKDLYVVLIALQQWSEKWVFAENEMPTQLVDRHKRETLAELKVVTKDGNELSSEDLRLIPGPGASRELQEEFVKRLAKLKSQDV